MTHLTRDKTALAVIAFVVILAIIGGIYVQSQPASTVHAAATFCGPHNTECVLNQPIPRAPSGPPVVQYVAPSVTSGHVLWQYLDKPYQQGGTGSCACYAFSRQFSYWYNKAHNLTGSHKVFFSCYLWYPYVTHGVDAGSYLTQYPPVLAAVGGVFATQWYWRDPLFPSGDPWPLPARIYLDASAHKFMLETYNLGTLGGGLQVIASIENRLSRHIPVNVASPVIRGTHGYEDSSGIIDSPVLSPGQVLKQCPATSPNIPPAPGPCVDGGHDTTLVAFFRNLCMFGTCGWFEGENNWGKAWGMRRSTDGRIRYDPTYKHNGYFMMSYRFAEQYSWDFIAMRLDGRIPAHEAPRASPPPPFHQPGPSLDKPLPPPPGTPKNFPKTVPSIPNAYVHGTYAKDVYNFDLGKIIDDAAHYYGIDAVGLLATIGAECGLFTHSTTCDRMGYGLDVSFGSCQVTVSTIASLGIGNGINDGYYGSNVTRVRTYENNAVNCIWKAAQYLGQTKSYLWNRPYDPCRIDFPQLYVAWNAGPGNPCWFLTNPTGQAGSNYYGNFLGWMRWAYQFAVGYNPYATPRPQPKPHRVVKFKYKIWCTYYRLHHRHCLSAWQSKGHMRWQAREFMKHLWLHGYVPRDAYFKKTRHRANAYMRYRFAHGYLYCWPDFGRCKSLSHHFKNPYLLKSRSVVLNPTSVSVMTRTP